MCKCHNFIQIYYINRHSRFNKSFTSCGGIFLKKELLRKMVFTFSTLLFTLWVFLIHINWNYIQNIRHSDPLWLVKGVWPWSYIIITIYVLLFLIIMNYDLKGKVFHLIFIAYLVLILDSTPYFLSTLYRFPDTINVVQGSVLLPEVLSDSITLPYPKSFPGSYMLFYIVHLLTGIDLFAFSRDIFSPLTLIAIFAFWYLLATHLFDSRIAFISTVVAIPSQIIEISLTPNSLAVVLTLISLYLCVSDKWNVRTLFYIVAILLVLTHAIHPIVLIVILVFFYFYNQITKLNTLDITRKKIYAVFFLWIAWIFSPSCVMGTGIVEAISRVLTLESKNWGQAYTYTVGSGNLAADYAWIQNLTMFKYELYALVLAFIIACDLYLVGFYAFHTHRTNILKEPKLIKKYSILLLGFILSTITLSNLIFGGSDTQNIVGRTLNYSMMFISLFIASFFSSLNISSKFLRKTIKVVFIAFLLISFVTYPLYSYGRDSYINYPASQDIGSDFFENHVSESKPHPHIAAHTKAVDFYQLMEGKNHVEVNMMMSTVYINGWYSINIQD